MPVTGGDELLPHVTAVVLAGGRSSRFGSDKLSAVVDGRPLLERALSAVAAVTPTIILVVAPGGEAAVPPHLTARTTVAHDPVAFGGPLVGLVAALEICVTPLVVVVGGDMPRLVPEVLRRLTAALGAGVSAATLEVPGRTQPLPIALDVAAARRSAGTVLEHGGRSLRDLLRDLDAVAIPAAAWRSLDPAGDTIADVDRPSDVDR